MVEVRREVRPVWPYRLPRAGPDGVMRRRRGGGLERLLHVEGLPAIVRVGQPARDRVVLVAGADSPDVAEEALRRMRFALGVDDDLRPFYERFRSDPLIGRSVRARPHLRVIRRPDPFEALAWAICEQLIEFERATAIQWRIVARLGRRPVARLVAVARLAGVAWRLTRFRPSRTGRLFFTVTAVRPGASVASIASVAIADDAVRPRSG